MYTQRVHRRLGLISQLGLGLILAGVVAGCGTAAPGATAAPSGQPVAQAAALIIDPDTVLGPKNLTDEEKPAKSCVQSGRFAHNEQIVWRARVIDGATGQPLDDQAMASLVVKLPDSELTMKYGGHPKSDPLDFFWTTSWLVPEGYPSGTIGYTIVATTKDGRTATWEQMKVASAMLTITDDVRTVLATPAPTTTP